LDRIASFVIINSMNNCKHCNRPFEKLQIHSKFCEENPKRQSNLDKLRKARESITPQARDKINEGIKKAWQRGSYENSLQNPARSGKKHTDEAKAVLSEKRKQWLKENPDLHPWKKGTKFVSEPCEHLKRLLLENLFNFVTEFSPLEDRFFAIDIVFPDLLFGIEVNGEQHYNRDRTLKKYYQERHDLIESKGWRILELHYAECYNNNVIQKIRNVIHQQQGDNNNA